MKQPGFTLIELVVVLSLVGLLSIVSLRPLHGWLSQVNLTAAAHLIAAELQALRSEAAAGHETKVFEPAALALPKGIRLSGSQQLSFSATGFPPPGGSGTLIAENSYGKQKKVILSSSGRVRIE
ncbi:MAG: prepilin-type N-terminal cleavage/methylation domain-containing protein [Candidatus Saganbacteria bacterium]|nr:prepilin-type N-terminal cleavage/methylation domain-containing protein [Candidatus Saganbacteria bacterium]